MGQEKTVVLQRAAKNIQLYRSERHMTIEQLAEAAGISAGFLANIENGRKSFSIVTLVQIANALEVSTDSILYESIPTGYITQVVNLLRDKTDDRLASIERLIRFCDEEFFREP